VVVRTAAFLMVLALAVSGCGESSIAKTELAEVVVRDGVPFDLGNVSTTVIDWLADHRVVVIGETHLIREQRQLTAAVVEALHARGYRQLLLEWPHFADWVMSDFVIDGDRGDAAWRPPTWLYGDLLTAIRDFNRSLPTEEKVVVRGIDVNLDEYGGATDFLASLGGLSRRLADPGPLDAFLQSDYETADEQTTALATLRDELDARRPELLGMWGDDWYQTISEMIDIETESVPIRTAREDNYDASAADREDVMKRICDRLIGATEGGTVINVGGNHAQKERLMGTEHEWLGDYLVNRSPVAAGDTIVVSVVPAKVTADYPTDLPDFDVLDKSPDNELFRLIAETWPAQRVFLPFDDPLFALDGVPMNYEGTIRITAPKLHYDAIVVLPLTHRIPLP